MNQGIILKCLKHLLSHKNLLWYLVQKRLNNNIKTIVVLSCDIVHIIFVKLTENIRHSILLISKNIFTTI